MGVDAAPQEAPPQEAPPHVAPVPRAALEVRVVDGDGLALPGVKVTVSGPNLMGYRTMVTDASGVLRFEDLPPGTVTVAAAREGFDKLRRDCEVYAGRRTILPLTLPLTVLDDPYENWSAQVFPRYGRRGGLVEASDLDVLPWVSLGGVSGLVAHPAFGLGEQPTMRVLGLAIPASAVSAIPLATVNRLDAQSVALEGGGAADIDLVRRDTEYTVGALTLAGSPMGDLGGTATVSGRLAGRYSQGVGSVEAGLLGEAAGLAIDARAGGRVVLEGGIFRADEALLGVARGSLYAKADRVARLGSLVVRTPDGVEGRAQISGTSSLWPANAHAVSGQVEAMGAAGRGALLLGGADNWRVGRWHFYGATRGRLDSSEAGRLEARAGFSDYNRRFSPFMSVGQRWEGIESLDAEPVRSREVLVGQVIELRRMMLTTSVLGATRVAPGEAGALEKLPGRADLQLAASREGWLINVLGTLTWRPPIPSFNEDLPEEELGLLLAWTCCSTDHLAPTVGLGLDAAHEDGDNSASVAARVALAITEDRFGAVLALEGSAGPDTLNLLWLSLKLSFNNAHQPSKKARSKT